MGVVTEIIDTDIANLKGTHFELYFSKVCFTKGILQELIAQRVDSVHCLSVFQ